MSVHTFPVHVVRNGNRFLMIEEPSPKEIKGTWVGVGLEMTVFSTQEEAVSAAQVYGGVAQPLTVTLDFHGVHTLDTRRKM